MRPPLWHPPIEVSTAEQAIIRRIRRAKLFVFLRQHRPTLFGDPFQEELATLSKDQPQGHPPVPPAQLALATLLQAYTGVSDDEVIAVTTMDRRWQLGLDGLDCDTPPFSKGTLVSFRHRLLAQQMDRRLVDRTLAVAAASGGFGPRQLRAALESSPLWGAGRVEDTSKLLGHALRKAVGVIARQQGRELPEVAAAAGAPLVAGSSLKAALALDWDAPRAQQHALTLVLDALTAVAHWRTTPGAHVEEPSQVAASMAVAQQGRAHDVLPAPAGGRPTLRHGVAEDRRMSVEDAEMRHGRKSRSLLVDGYKRHGLRALDSGLIVAGGVTPANAPEAPVTDAIATDLAAQQSTLERIWPGSWSNSAVRSWPFSAQPGQDVQGRIFPKARCTWIGSGTSCGVRVERVCPLSLGASCRFPRLSVPAVHCGSAAPRARRAGASVCTPMKPCCRSCVNVSRLRRDARSCASGWRWNTPWPTSGTGRADAPAIVGCGRTCLLCDDVLSYIICMSWRACQR